MLKHPFRRKLIAVSIAAVMSPLVSAANVSDTYHKDFRNTVKIDLLPNSVLKSSLTGEAQAKEFLAINKQKYGLQSNLQDLVFTKVKSSLLGEHYHYQQYLNGVKVDKAEIIVSISKQNEVMRVFNNTFPVVKDIAAQPKTLLGSNVAAEKVWNFLQVSGKLRIVPQSNLVYMNIGAEFKLAYKVNMTVTKPFGDWEFYLDAKSGDVINAYRIDLPIYKNANVSTGTGKWQAFAKNANQKPYSEVFAAIESVIHKAPNPALNKADASGVVFDPDPVTTLNDDTLEDTSPAGSFDAAYFTKTLKDVTLENGTYSLVGPWVTIADFESPNTAPSTTTDGTWEAKRGDNSFNDAMTYFHIDQNQRYMQSLGFVDATGIQFVSINVDTDGVDGDDNSHFLPGTNQLAFGHGCVDDNEDIDVILHEYGHAINFSINSSFSGGDTGAIGEGFGDYWAASYSYSTPNGLSFHPEWAFSWDGNNACWGGRKLNRTSFRYDPNASYAAHAVVGGVLGDELWSTPLAETLIALMNAGVARDEVDQIILEAQFGLGAGLKMPDMAAAIVSTASRLFPNGQHAATFNSNFKMMNILGEPMVAEAVSIISGGNNDIADPGETVTFNIPLKNNGGVSVSQVSATLSTSAAGVTLGTAASDYPDIAASVSATNSTPFELTIPANQVCGSGIALSMAVNFTEGSAQNSTFDVVLPVGDDGVAVSISSSPGAAIPDNNTTGITDQITMAGSLANSNISIDVDITHTWRGDLTLTLTSPAGTSVILQNSASDADDNIVGNYPDSLTPAESLSAFDGEDHNGTWSLKIVDSGAQDLGTLNSWAVNSIAPACNANSAPEAAVVNETIAADEAVEVTLDATPSSDSDGDDLTFAWSQSSGTSVTLTNSDTVQASFTSPDVVANEELVFEVLVTDTNGASDTATVTVSVADGAGNNRPIAEVESTDLDVTVGDDVNLDATSSTDPDGDDITFLWEQTSGTAVTLSNATTSVASFNADTAGNLTFDVTVTDTAGATSTKTVNVVVNPPNEAPTAIASASPATVTEGGNVNLNASASTDPNGDALTYEWTQTSGAAVTLSNAGSAQASFTAPQVTDSIVLQFSVTVSDPDGASDTSSVSVTVNDTPESSSGGGSLSLWALLLLPLLRRQRNKK